MTQMITLRTAHSCGACPIRHQAVCAHCDADELNALERIKYYRSFQAGQTVVWAGDRMDFVASVVSGTAALSHTMQDGRRQMVGLLLASDFLGRPGRDLAPYDVTAVTDLVMCCFRRAGFEALIRNTPHVGYRLLEMTLDELDAARGWMALLGRKTAREKITSLLMIFARRVAVLGNRPTNAATFDLPLTRAAMGDYLGLTLETVSRQLSTLKAEHLILLPGLRKVGVPDLAALWAETGDDADGLPGWQHRSAPVQR